MNMLINALIAAIMPLFPENGATVALMPECQKSIIAITNNAERLGALTADSKKSRKDPTKIYTVANAPWRQSQPFEVAFETTDREKGPWCVEISKTRDFAKTKAWSFSWKSNAPDGGGTNRVYRYTLAWPNLEVGTEYFWRVSNPREKNVTTSEVFSFRTEDFAPRWITIEGCVNNIRDLGGRTSEDGKWRVRQGLIYRGQGFNDRSNGCVRDGRNRLLVEDVRFLKGELGIRTDLDLRGGSEVWGMKESPLGPDVRWVNISSTCYGGSFSEVGRKVTARLFRQFCNETNYPVYFHCVGGADRTGTLAYIMQGLLGVTHHEAQCDYEHTFYPAILGIKQAEDGTLYSDREKSLDDGLSKYGDAQSSFQERCEMFIKDCGITDAELAEFRRIMLEPYHAEN